MRFAVRPTSYDDLVALRDIEREAGEQFRAIGLPDVADAEPFSIEVLAGYASDGRCWVAVDEAGHPVGYVLVDIVDGNAHVEQISVRPEHQGAGAGRALMDRVQTWARALGLPAITLTTFVEVPWNAPLYRHLGFRVLDDERVGPELRAIRDTEAAQGLDPAQRVCMLRAVLPTS
jgi:ribosomal protein S18 acetylase RimI-like enzyme